LGEHDVPIDIPNDVDLADAGMVAPAMRLPRVLLPWVSSSCVFTGAVLVSTLPGLNPVATRKRQNKRPKTQEALLTLVEAAYKT